MGPAPMPAVVAVGARAQAAAVEAGGAKPVRAVPAAAEPCDSSGPTPALMTAAEGGQTAAAAGADNEEPDAVPAADVASDSSRKSSLMGGAAGLLPASAALTASCTCT
jgi:hypothetical protein